MSAIHYRRTWTSERADSERQIAGYRARSARRRRNRSVAAIPSRGSCHRFPGAAGRGRVGVADRRKFGRGDSLQFPRSADGAGDAGRVSDLSLLSANEPLPRTPRPLGSLRFSPARRSRAFCGFQVCAAISGILRPASPANQSSLSIEVSARYIAALSPSCRDRRPFGEAAPGTLSSPAH